MSQPSTKQQCVSFSLADESYCVLIGDVQEIIRMEDIVNIPNSPYFIEGIINIRGRVLPIIHLRKRFNMPAVDQTQSSRIIVVNLDGVIAGLIVDQVNEVINIDGNKIETPPDIITSENQRFLSGIANLGSALILILDVKKLLSEKEHEMLKKTDF